MMYGYKITQKIALAIMLFAFGSRLSGQINMAFHSIYEIPGRMVKLNDNFFFNTISYSNPSNYFIFPCYLYGITENHILFKNQVNKGESTIISDMITTMDKSIIYFGGDHGCDNPGINPTFFMTKIDT